MKLLRALSLILIISCLACEGDVVPVYNKAFSPYLEFKKATPTDSGVYQFEFEIWDREGDIGAIDVFNVGSYSYLHFVLDANDVPVTISNEVTPPFYLVEYGSNGYGSNELKMETKQWWKDVDDRPEFACSDYREANILVDGKYVNDTYWILKKPDYFNLLVVAYLNDELYAECNELHELFPSIQSNYGGSSFEIRKINKYRTYLRYGIFSVLFVDPNSPLKKMRYEFQIRDEALNYSNTISTDDIVLSTDGDR